MTIKPLVYVDNSQLRRSFPFVSLIRRRGVVKEGDIENLTIDGEIRVEICRAFEVLGAGAYLLGAVSL